MPADRAKPTILVVHDDRVMHHLFREICAFEGYPVEVAETGVEVLEILARQPRPYRIMVIQPLLHDVDEMTLIHYVRSEPAVAERTKVVAMTVYHRLLAIPDDAVDGKLQMPLGADALLAIFERLS